MGLKVGRRFITRLVEKELVRPNGILIVPGNHDIEWGKPARGRGRFTYRSREDAELLYQAMCRGAFDELRIDCPLYPELGMAIRFDDGTELVGLNSCRAETGYTQAAGFVGLDQLLKLCAEVKGPKHKVPRIAILHHSLLDEDSQYLPELFRDLGDHHVDTLCDGLTIRDAMPRLGFSLVLHGHIHQVKEYPAAGLDVRSAASVSVRFPESLSLNQFQVLDLNGRDLKIHCFRTPSPSAEDPVWEHQIGRAHV